MTGPVVRTHSVRMVRASDLRSSLCWVECRGCGERWPYDTPFAEAERQPCGTREGGS